MHKQLSNFAEIREIEVDGTNDVTHAVDTQNFDGVLFILKADDGSADFQAQQSDSLVGDILENGADIGDNVTVDASDETVFFDIYRPDKRYVAVNVKNSDHVDVVYALKYHSRVRPVNNKVNEEIQGEVLVSPDEE